MSGFAAQLGRQLSAPQGVGGWLAAKAMRFANRRPIRLTVDALGVCRGDAVLDLGCGDGAAIPLLLARTITGAVYGLDHSPAMLALARRRHPAAQFRAGRFERLPFADRSFDRVLAVNVAYFWHDDARVIAEIRRVLRPGGRLALYATDGAALRRLGLDRTGTHRMLGERELRTMLGVDGAVSLIDAGFGTPGWIGTWTKEGAGDGGH